MTANFKKRGRDEQLYVGVPSDVQALLTRAAAERGRSVSALVYIILHNCTAGFTDLSAADRPLIEAPLSETTPGENT